MQDPSIRTTCLISQCAVYMYCYQCIQYLKILCIFNFFSLNSISSKFILISQSFFSTAFLAQPLVIYSGHAAIVTWIIPCRLVSAPLWRPYKARRKKKSPSLRTNSVYHAGNYVVASEHISLQLSSLFALPLLSGQFGLPKGQWCMEQRRIK